METKIIQNKIERIRKEVEKREKFLSNLDYSQKDLPERQLQRNEIKGLIIALDILSDAREDN